MNATIRNTIGVLLRYEHDVVLNRKNAERASVAQMGELLEAERALREIMIIAECADISDCGVSAMLNRLSLIHRFIHRQRVGYGMPTPVIERQA